MDQSTITIDVSLDQDKIPDNITWQASASTLEKPQQARAMMLSFWDPKDRAALRIDLWTKEMMVDEMADFYYQTFMTMADSFERATHQPELVNSIKEFARQFHTRFRELQQTT